MKITIRKALTSLAIVVTLLAGLGVHQATAASSWKTRGMAMSSQSWNDGATWSSADGWVTNSASEARITATWWNSNGKGTRIEGNWSIWCDGPNYRYHTASKSFSRWVGHNETVTIKSWPSLSSWSECEVSVTFDTYAGPDISGTAKAYIQQR